MTTDVVSKAIVYYTQVLELRIFPLHDVESGVCSCDDGEACSPSRAGKHPRVGDWAKQSSKSPRKLSEWWQQWPNANIGIPTGSINRFFVLDIDPHNGGWLAYQDAGLAGELPPTYAPMTGSGGQHFWFRYPDEEVLGWKVTNHNKLPRGLDVRGNGGYVVGAPSTSLKGSYPWPDPLLVDLADLAECPPDILERYLKPEVGEWDLVERDSCADYELLSVPERERIDRYCRLSIKKEMVNLKGLTAQDEWDNETFRISCKILELAKAPWSPITYEMAIDAIRRSVPTPDGEGWTERRIELKIKSAWERINSHDLVRPFPEPPTGSKAKADVWELKESRLILRPFSDRVASPYEWYEPNWIPKKGVVVLAGDPGSGKSTLLCHWIAKFTDGAWGAEEGSPCIYMAGTEDSLDDVVKPRLVAARADVSRVFTVEVEERNDEDSYIRRASFNQDLSALSTAVKEGGIKAIFMDPANTFLGIDEERDSYSEIRMVLEKVIKFADEHSILIVLIKHFKKAQQGVRLDAKSRLYGSAAWSEVPRHLVVLRRVDDDLRDRKGLDSEDMISALLSVEKNSYGRDTNTGFSPVGFAHEDVRVSVDNLKGHIVSKFVSLGERKDLNDLDSIATLTDDQVDKKIQDDDAAKQWLIETLQGFDGRIDMTALKLIHEKDNRITVSWRTMLRKADLLGIRKEKIPGAKDNRKEWILPPEYMPKSDDLKM